MNYLKPFYTGNWVDIYEPFGISEQNDVFAENQDVARKILDYLEENNITDKNVLISE